MSMNRNRNSKAIITLSILITISTALPVMAQMNCLNHGQGITTCTSPHGMVTFQDLGNGLGVIQGQHGSVQTWTAPGSVGMIPVEPTHSLSITKPVLPSD